ncbi:MULTISPECIES: AtpZ/AtpI family protein [Methylomicrobium]|uniref:Putative F0F1-ATPase subunit (ATPase_gene1) n=1 Tax=Methylomicrobium album BG8 TaxID=686340 RepID=H8GIS2_METAL|nr:MULTISPECIES: AtpZ/AtpI family protein [Methylomicrobium]EIC30262.1 Putative F0F1-ATPase subunit (ATPase_gene1) [Methylomicrobium album BG8]
MPFRRKLLEQTQRDIKRLKNKGHKPTTLLGIFLYGGTLGFLFVVPIVGGAYLGLWLDELIAGYSEHWTLNLILLGIAVGGYNVFRFLRDKT